MSNVQPKLRLKCQQFENVGAGQCAGICVRLCSQILAHVTSLHGLNPVLTFPFINHHHQSSGFPNEPNGSLPF